MPKRLDQISLGELAAMLRQTELSVGVASESAAVLRREIYRRGTPICVGIDPGASGGICIIIHSAWLMLYPMPETELDIWEIIHTIDSYYPRVRVCIERILPNFAGLSKVSAAKTYGSYVQICMALTAAKLAFDPILPQQWHKLLKLRKKKKEEPQPHWKNYLRGQAQRLFPNCAIWQEPKYKQLAVSDAMLIAEYARRTL